MTGLRLHPLPNDPLNCDHCASSAFTIYAGADKGITNVECVNCGHRFELRQVEELVTVRWYANPPVPLKRL